MTMTVQPGAPAAATNAAAAEVATPDGAPSQAWQWRIDRNHYDHHVDLLPGEWTQLASLRASVRETPSSLGVVRSTPRNSFASPRLLDLLKPLEDVLNLVGPGSVPNWARSDVIGIVLNEMQRRRRTYWAWTIEDWLETLGSDPTAFRARHHVPINHRQLVMAIAYLLCDFTDLSRLGAFERRTFCDRVFGPGVVSTADIQKIIDVLPKSFQRLARTVLYDLLLANHSPRVADLIRERVDESLYSCTSETLRPCVRAVARALERLGIITAVRPAHSTAPTDDPDSKAMRQTTSFVPVDCSRYDRSPSLSPTELACLDRLVNHLASGGRDRTGYRDQVDLRRLLSPVRDAIQRIGVNERSAKLLLRVLLREMHTRKRSFWRWSASEWLETLGMSSAAFQERHRVSPELRLDLVAIAYLLVDFKELQQLEGIKRFLLANRVFGPAMVQSAIAQVSEAAQALGYGEARAREQLPAALVAVLLESRSPHIKDITQDVLERVWRSPLAAWPKGQFVALSRALASLSCAVIPLASDTKPGKHMGRGAPDPSADDIDPEWIAWCDRWRANSPLADRSVERPYYALLRVGRWLREHHPEIRSPQQWTAALAAEYVVAVEHMAVGAYVHASPSYQPQLHRVKQGLPLTASTRSGELSAVRRFFRDCQRWDWALISFDAPRAFATRHALRAQLASRQRAKHETLEKVGAHPNLRNAFLRAALLLTEADLARVIPGARASASSECSASSTHSDSASSATYVYYPLEMVRAFLVVWLVTGLHPRHCRLLCVGCVHQAGRENASSRQPIAEQALYVLELPPVKRTTATSALTAQTQEVPGFVAEAVGAWERIRPAQPPAVDRQTGEAIHLLFSYRGAPIGATFSILNERLIPVLNSKAGFAGVRGVGGSGMSNESSGDQASDEPAPRLTIKTVQWAIKTQPLAEDALVQMERIWRDNRNNMKAEQIG